MNVQQLLSRCFFALALAGTPLAAAADPVTISATEPRAATVSDADHYAALEKQTPAAATFEGGGGAIYIGGSALTIVLVILLIVIIL